MKKFSSLVLLGCSLVSGFAFAQDDVPDLREVHIGEIRVWDCGCDAAPGGGIYSVLSCQFERDKEVAEDVQGRMWAMSSIHWSLSRIVPSYMGGYLRGPAIFSVGVFEGSRIPEIKEIVAIAKSAAKCGELVVGPYHYPF